ncbi:MAG: type II toxin-antitoxin system RelE/ParE family toxin [Firmicutes bacterium]|nr:type II toxin-antitoxin system RelE/ParE family toxin [Bacillota bacterium]
MEEFKVAISMAMNSLATMPFRYPLVHNERLAAKGIRFLPCNNYLIFFNVEETKKIVHIQHIFHASRNWVELLL